MKTYIEIKNNANFITLDNENGLKITLCSYGASIFDLFVIDKDNNLESVLIRPTDIETFFNNTGYYGKTIGRFSGRIDNSKCIIGGKEYVLDKNWNGINSLHGGAADAISHKNWNYDITDHKEYTDVIFTYLEKEHYLPGDINYKITYRVYKTQNTFTIYFEAVSNKETLINLTNHAYFNLSGNGKRTILNQTMKLYCDSYTNLNNNLIANSIDKVNEIMDFTNEKEIGKHINDISLQDHKAFGYDHCFIKANEDLDEIALLTDKQSGRRLSVYTSLPSVVCYSTNYPDSKNKFNVEKDYIEKYHGITLECQYIPNGINMENVHKAIYQANERYSHFVTYKFDII